MDDKSARRRASQWSFIYPLATSAFIDHISNPPTDILCIAFAICDNDTDTGNQFLQGFVKTRQRIRINPVRALIGPAIFLIATCPSEALVETWMTENSEIGDRMNLSIQLHQLCQEMSSFKRNVKEGSTNLGQSHPTMFTKYLDLSLRYINTHG